MKQISNKEYEKYQQYQTDKLYGRILTPDGLRVVCAGLDNDPEKIGIHMLEMRFRDIILGHFTVIGHLFLFQMVVHVCLLKQGIADVFFIGKHLPESGRLPFPAQCAVVAGVVQPFRN